MSVGIILLVEPRVKATNGYIDIYQPTRGTGPLARLSTSPYFKDMPSATPLPKASGAEDPETLGGRDNGTSISSPSPESVITTFDFPFSRAIPNILNLGFTGWS